MCTDAEGSDFMQVAIKSVFHNNRDTDIEIHILSDCFTDNVTSALDSLAAAFGQKITLHIVDPARLTHLPTTRSRASHIPTAAYYRFMIPDVIAPEISRILYLDTDTLVTGPLLPLWRTDFGDAVAAAVMENNDMKAHGIDTRLGLPQGCTYYNSGVILINLPRWRELNISERCLSWLDNHPDIAEFHDQDALNVITQGMVKFVHPKYNLVTSFILKENYATFAPPEVCDEAISRPVIIHYTSFKPWVRYIPPVQRHSPRLFRRYRRMNPVTTIKHRPARYICISWADYRYWLKTHRHFGRFFRALSPLWQIITCFRGQNKKRESIA